MNATAEFLTCVHARNVINTSFFTKKRLFEISSMPLSHWVSHSSISSHNYSSIYLSQWDFFMMFFFLPIFSYFCASVQTGVGEIWNIKYRRNTYFYSYTYLLLQFPHFGVIGRMGWNYVKLFIKLWYTLGNSLQSSRKIYKRRPLKQYWF